MSEEVGLAMVLVPVLSFAILWGWTYWRDDELGTFLLGCGLTAALFAWFGLAAWLIAA